MLTVSSAPRLCLAWRVWRVPSGPREGTARLAPSSSRSGPGWGHPARPGSAPVGALGSSCRPRWEAAHLQARPRLPELFPGTGHRARHLLVQRLFSHTIPPEPAVQSRWNSAPKAGAWRTSSSLWPRRGELARVYREVIYLFLSQGLWLLPWRPGAPGPRPSAAPRARSPGAHQGAVLILKFRLFVLQSRNSERGCSLL